MKLFCSGPELSLPDEGDGEKFVVITVIPTCWNHAFILKRARAPEFPCSLDLSHKFRQDLNESKKCPPTKAVAKRLVFSLDFLLDKKLRKKSSRLATLLSESSGVV